MADNLIGNKEAAPNLYRRWFKPLPQMVQTSTADGSNLNRWLDERLSFKSRFEK